MARTKLKMALYTVSIQAVGESRRYSEPINFNEEPLSMYERDGEKFGQLEQALLGDGGEFSKNDKTTMRVTATAVNLEQQIIAGWFRRGAHGVKQDAYRDGDVSNPIEFNENDVIEPKLEFFFCLWMPSGKTTGILLCSGEGQSSADELMKTRLKSSVRNVWPGCKSTFNRFRLPDEVDQLQEGHIVKRIELKKNLVSANGANRLMKVDFWDEEDFELTLILRPKRKLTSSRSKQVLRAIQDEYYKESLTDGAAFYTEELADLTDDAGMIDRPEATARLETPDKTAASFQPKSEVTIEQNRYITTEELGINSINQVPTKKQFESACLTYFKAAAKALHNVSEN